MSSTLIFICIGVAVLVTSFIFGILGMAGGMILMGVLLALLPLPAAMMLHGITQLASNGWRAWLRRTHVNWRVFRGYALDCNCSRACPARCSMCSSCDRR